MQTPMDKLAPSLQPDPERLVERTRTTPGDAAGNRALARAATQHAAALPSGRGLTANRSILAHAAAPRQLMRLVAKLPTNKGEFTIDTYDLHENDNGDTAKRCGLEIEATFESPFWLRSSKIGFVQVMKVTKNGVPYLFTNEVNRQTNVGSGDAGWVVDRVGGKKWGFYGMNDDETPGGNMRLGMRTDSAATDAYLYDKVGLSRAVGMTIDCTAMSFAVDIEHGKYLGGFSWGWSIDAAGTMTAKRPAVAQMGDVQIAAIKGWNAQAALANVPDRNAPGQELLPEPVTQRRLW